MAGNKLNRCFFGLRPALATALWRLKASTDAMSVWVCELARVCVCVCVWVRVCVCVCVRVCVWAVCLVLIRCLEQRKSHCLVSSGRQWIKIQYLSDPIVDSAEILRFSLLSVLFIIFFFFKGLFSKGPTVALARKFMEKDENPFQSRSGFVSGFVRFALPLEFDHFQLISSKIDSLLINLMWWMLIEWSQLITDADYQSSNKFLSQMVDWFSSITKLVSNDRNSWPVMKIF